jgi:hypothetical protein
MNALFELLANKQRLIATLEDLDEQVKTYHVDAPEARHWPTPEMREQCQLMVSLCNQLLANILATDNEAEALLVSQKNAVHLQLKQLDNKIQVQRAYHKQQDSTSVSPRSSGIDWGIG